MGVTVTPLAYRPGVAEYHPWRDLRSRSHIVFRLVELPDELGGALYFPRGERAVILIDPRLSRRERSAALAHELVHDERGGGVDFEGAPETWSAVVAKEEAIVDRIVAERLVPIEELAEFVDGMVSTDQPVDARAAADWFDVPEAVAERALRLLALQRRESA